MANLLQKWFGKVEAPQPQAGVKFTGSGVTWVGSPDFRQIIRLDAQTVPDADELSRAIAYATSAYCYTAISYRAAKVAEPFPYVMREDDEDGEEVLADHDLMELFGEPSPDFDLAELLALTESYRLISGAVLWLKMRDSAGRMARLMPFSGDEVRTFSQDGLIYGRFEVLTDKGRWEPYAPEDVVWMRDVNPSSWRNNLSKLDVALAQLDLGHQVNRTVRNFMRKAMFPGGVISPHPDWDPDDDEWDKYLNDIRAWNSGPANAGNALVVAGGTTFSRSAIPLKELLPGELLDRIEAVVSATFGVPPIVLGWKIGIENSPWSQMSEARQTVYEETFIPRWNELSRKLTRQMLTKEERLARVQIKFDLTDIAALREDDLARAEVAVKLVNDWTRNERRIYTGQEPLPEDDPRGDEIGVSGGGLGGLFGDAPPADEEEEPDEDEEEGTEDTEGDEDDDEEGDEDEEAGKGLRELLSSEYLGDVKRLEGKALEWVLFDVNTKAAESYWYRTVLKLLQEQQDEIAKLAARYIRPAKADTLDPDSAAEFVVALAKWTKDKGKKKLSRGLYGLIVSTGTTAAKRAAAQVGLSFTVLEPFLLTYAAEEADFLASVMGETTGHKVAAVVQKRLEAGGVLRDLQKDLQESAAFSRNRAKLVARTETTRAWNGAQRRSLSGWASVQDDATVVYKEWVSAGDDRVRDEHVMVDGDKVRIDEPYSNGLMEPSEPNCRCTQVFSLGGARA